MSYDVSLFEFSDLNDIVVESPFVFKSWNFVPFDCDIVIKYSPVAKLGI